jgi:6-phosphogluconolactonase
MLTKTRYSRRGFLEVLASSSVVTATAPYVAWLPAGAQIQSARTKFAYVASWKANHHGIHVLGNSRNEWEPAQFVPCAAPSGFALSADQRVLFVANCIRRFNGLPTGSVESYRVHASSGHLGLISRVPLALSAVEPQHLAVSPDGTYLAVAVTGGGSYNLLPIAPDGSLGAVAMLRKEIGCGPEPSLQSCARPGQLTFDAEGHLLTTDLGADRVTSFHPETDSLTQIERRASQPGSGPASLALHSSAGLLFVGHALDGTIRTHRYRSNGATFDSGRSVSASPLSSVRLSGLALHPSGELLFSAWHAGAGEEQFGLSAWRIHAAHATLLPLDEIRLKDRLTAISCTPDGRSVFALSETGTAALLDIDAHFGRFGSSRIVASVPNAKAAILTRL